jgi:hypothetical protein
VLLLELHPLYFDQMSTVAIRCVGLGYDLAHWQMGIRFNENNAWRRSGPYKFTTQISGPQSIDGQFDVTEI